MIVLDTHSLLWLDTDDKRLGAAARRLIETAWSDHEVAVSAISFWECALLAQHGRIRLPGTPAAWRLSLLATGLLELPIDGGTAMLAVDLPDLHKDPADRLIAATAIATGATLLTADERLLAWRHDLPRHDART